MRLLALLAFALAPLAPAQAQTNPVADAAIAYDRALIAGARQLASH